jgi:hypothetical protein
VSRYCNLYNEVANPLFESDGVDYRRAVFPSDPDGYLPDDLVVPYESTRQLADDEPLMARDVRSALWLAAGDIRRAAARLGVPPGRIRAFIKNSQWVQAEADEAKESILDKAEEILFEALFSDDAGRRDSAAKYILTKSKIGSSRLHAFDGHLELNEKPSGPTIRWADEL